MFMSDWLKLISKKPSDGYKRFSREWGGGGKAYHLLGNDIGLGSSYVTIRLTSLTSNDLGNHFLFIPKWYLHKCFLRKELFLGCECLCKIKAYIRYEFCKWDIMVW